MDKALKERIVGAVVLVVLAVLIVPVFLDGPAGHAESIQEAITLPGQDGQRVLQKTVVLERDRKQPVPLAQGAATDSKPKPKPAKPKATPTPPTQEPVEQPAQKSAVKTEFKVAKASADSPDKSAQTTGTKTASVPKSSTGMWAVQLGSFSDQGNAERLAANLRGDGYAAFLSQLKSGSKQLHRVRVGPQKDRVSAESVAAKLTKAGHKGQVVPHP